MSAERNTRLNEVVLEGLLDYLTPTDAEVAEWHFVNVTMQVDRQRPLVQLLFWLVEDPRHTPPAVPAADACIDLRTVPPEPKAPSHAAPLLFPTAA